MDIMKIKQIISVFEESSIARMDLEIEDIKIRLEKPNTQINYVQQAPAQNVVQSVEEVEVTKGSAIKSPLVGTYYEAAAQGERAFVQVGQQVKKGDTLCIIEAMKVMNEIKAQSDGVIVDILGINGEMVQFDDVLMYIE